ncbi:MAG: ABC transporter ATP-binding protein, partial [Actinobacteria bacterium]|nr:ABC transporter ATP-binding protein [Actinomycetota bacterium]
MTADSAATDNAPVVTATNVVKTFGGLRAVDVEKLEIRRNKITALIGPNGAG